MLCSGSGQAVCCADVVEVTFACASRDPGAGDCDCADCCTICLCSGCVTVSFGCSVSSSAICCRNRRISNSLGAPLAVSATKSKLEANAARRRLAAFKSPVPSISGVQRSGSSCRSNCCWWWYSYHRENAAATLLCHIRRTERSSSREFLVFRSTANNEMSLLRC